MADGTAAAIKRGAHARTLRFRLAAPDSTALAALPGVQAVDIAGDRVLVRTADPDATARALLRTDLDVRELELGGPDLEEAFLALTGGER